MRSQAFNFLQGFSHLGRSGDYSISAKNREKQKIVSKTLRLQLLTLDQFRLLACPEKQVKKISEDYSKTV